jgi:hypothetical protein
MTVTNKAALTISAGVSTAGRNLRGAMTECTVSMFLH